MYVSEDMIDGMKALYGHPNEANFRFGVSNKEFRLIRDSQKHGRRHDVTLYIVKDDKIVVIAKPFYQPGLYRAPSGGLQPDESFQKGIDREVWEETGCEIELEKFLLRTQV
ncbi:MAG: NUDIX domain-containing protein, partial [candidate division Zixibacteria bacterium]|nr:NUDIX domain-containing protein [candidate division Zixibacteria bacterium]